MKRMSRVGMVQPEKKENGVTVIMKIKNCLLANNLQPWTTLRKAGMLSWASWSILLCALIFIVLRLFGEWEIFLPNGGDNARYFLSAVAQALACLFAMVITISLIIMQLLTQTYTSAIFEIYIKRIRVLVSFFVSGFVIIFSLYVLLQIQNRYVCHWECVKTDIVLVLVAFSVVWNVIYFFDLLGIVKPNNFLKIIDSKLHRSTNKKEVLTVIGEICSIGMKKGDIATSNSCLSIFDRIMFDLTAEDRAHLSDILKKLFEKAIENDSSEMIYAIVRISFYRTMMRFWEVSGQQ
jgi:hypothetical protein